MDFDLALRMFMDSFRPPGEGQKIDRIMQVGGWVGGWPNGGAASRAAGSQGHPAGSGCGCLQPASQHPATATALAWLVPHRPPLHCCLPAPTPPCTAVPQVFGKRYHEQMPSMGLRSTDAAYVLAFSVIMLNTDLHNTQVTILFKSYCGCLFCWWLGGLPGRGWLAE